MLVGGVPGYPVGVDSLWVKAMNEDNKTRASFGFLIFVKGAAKPPPFDTNFIDWNKWRCRCVYARPMGMMTIGALVSTEGRTAQTYLLSFTGWHSGIHQKGQRIPLAE
jgi:hypothetical protein